MAEQGLTERGVVLVTGAAGGLGQAIAASAVAAGYTVALADRVAEALHATADRLGATAYPCDLLDTEALTALVGRVEGKCGPLMGLVNNAGLVKTQPFTAATAREWDAVFGVNARAPFLLMQAAGERMAARGQGAIVNIASVAGRSARPEQTLYGASKAALLHLTKSAAAFFGPRGVRVNAVCPGVVDTAMTREVWRDRKPEDVARILRDIPLGRIATPDEVARVAVWLLGDGAGYVNGQALNVCGGLEMD